ncbi:MAG: radical SAM protein [Clostridia bacterium]|nr:radical SAM protein [Clostridia bacterium]
MKKKIAIIMCNDMHMDIERSNVLLNYIMQNGSYEIVCDYTIANIVIIQTCAFGEKKKYSVQVIADVRANSRSDAKVIVTGCLLSINKEELEAIPGIEVKSFKELINFFKKSKICHFEKIVPQNRVIVSEGCLKKCSYCVYPLIVGNYKSKPIEDVLLEVEDLYDTETTIYITGAQETSDYGIDLYGKPSFPKLLQKICTQFPDCNYVIGWFHPVGLTDEMISVISQNKNIVEIMLHIQHVSDTILKKMNRPSFEFTDKRIQKLKELRPDLIISTEVIVGFPGETQLEFQNLVKYLEKGYFSDIGVASYEQVLETPASIMENQIPLEIRQKRLNFIKDRFGACAYPTSNNFEMSVIEEYLKSYSFFKTLPKNILNNRQKYNCIAGVDTNIKLKLEEVLQEVSEYISASRSEFDFQRNQKYLREKYTLEVRSMFYSIFENGNFKKGIKQKAKKLLLCNGS